MTSLAKVFPQCARAATKDTPRYAADMSPRRFRVLYLFVWYFSYLSEGKLDALRILRSNFLLTSPFGSFIFYYFDADVKHPLFEITKAYYTEIRTTI